MFRRVADRTHERSFTLIRFDTGIFHCRFSEWMKSLRGVDMTAVRACEMSFVRHKLDRYMHYFLEDEISNCFVLQTPIGSAESKNVAATFVNTYWPGR